MSGHPSEALATAVVEALSASGVRDVVYCPGSRSAPLAYALDRAQRSGRLRVIVRLDERGAAFTAVGLARAGAIREGSRPGSVAPGYVDEGDTARMRAASRFWPVAVVTTSGGAVAELHAGVAEADASGVPLVVVSADRPFEMRGVGASQTTTQPGIFGPHVRAVWDVPAGQEPDTRLRSLVARAVATACGLPSGHAGPVQINVGLRDPLVPEDPVSVRPRDTGAPDRRWTAPRVPPARLAPLDWEEAVDPDLRTVLVAGDGADPQAGLWAQAAGVPLLAEPSSGVTRSPAWVPHQQSLLADPRGLSSEVQQVVVTGRPTVSRPVSRILARVGVRVVVHSASPRWTDVAGRAGVVVPALAPARAVHPDDGWAPRWRRASRAVTRAIRPLAEPDGASAPTMVSAAHTVWRSAAGVLVLGASTTVRAVDLVASGPGRADVVSNRGLAGIDGTLATALGVSWGAGVPVRAVMGDLTFLHDAASLMVGAQERDADVQVIVLDDAGGSIFAGLEHGRPEYGEAFERWFATPQRSSVEGLAQAYGASHHRVRTVDELRSALDRPVRGREVVHVPVPRDPALLARVRDATRRAP